MGDVLSASLAERLRAHAGAIREIAGLVPGKDSGIYRDSERVLVLLRAVESLTFVAHCLEVDALEAPRETRP